MECESLRGRGGGGVFQLEEFRSVLVVSISQCSRRILGGLLGLLGVLQGGSGLFHEGFRAVLEGGLQ